MRAPVLRDRSWCSAPRKLDRCIMEGSVQSEGAMMRKRRQFSPEFKARVVLDILTGVQPQAEACRKHGLGPNLVALWKASFLERAHLVFDSDSARSAEQARIAELEQ